MPQGTPSKRIMQGAKQDTASSPCPRSLDRSLDEIEDNPLPGQKELYEFSRGPVGIATGKGLAAAANLTAKVRIRLLLHHTHLSFAAIGGC